MKGAKHTVKESVSKYQIDPDQFTRHAHHSHDREARTVRAPLRQLKSVPVESRYMHSVGHTIERKRWGSECSEKSRTVAISLRPCQCRHLPTS